jgi:hypothetical protein
MDMGASSKRKKDFLHEKSYRTLLGAVPAGGNEVALSMDTRHGEECVSVM